MSSRARIQYQPASASSGGGGGGTTGSLEWGPSFGQSAGDDQSTWDVGANLDLLSVNVANTKSVGDNIDLESFLLSNDKTLGVDILADLGYTNDKTIGVDMTGDLSYSSDKTVGIGTTDGLSLLDAVALNHVPASPGTPASHLSGTVISAPFWQSVGTANNGNATGTSDIAIPKPSGLAVGDLMVAFVTFSRTAASTPVMPAGWTSITNVNSDTASTFHHSRAAWKIADSSDVAASTFTFTGPYNRATGEVHRIIGTDATTPIHLSATASVAIADLNPDPVVPAVTTTIANCLIFRYCAHGHAALTQTHTWTAPITERTDFEATDTATILGSTSATRVQAATGTTGTATCNCTETVGTEATQITVAVAPGTLTIAS